MKQLLNEFCLLTEMTTQTRNMMISVGKRKNLGALIVALTIVDSIGDNTFCGTVLELLVLFTVIQMIKTRKRFHVMAPVKQIIPIMVRLHLQIANHPLRLHRILATDDP